jgi:hypothetical protein
VEVCTVAGDKELHRRSMFQRNHSFHSLLPVSRGFRDAVRCRSLLRRGARLAVKAEIGSTGSHGSGYSRDGSAICFSHQFQHQADFIRLHGREGGIDNANISAWDC